MPLTETDRQLINRLLSGSSAGWGDFVERYAPLVTQVIRHTAHAHSLKLNSDDLDDLTADVLAALLERDMAAIRSFRGRSSFATYLTVVNDLVAKQGATTFNALDIHKVLPFWLGNSITPIFRGVPSALVPSSKMAPWAALSSSLIFSRTILTV